MGGGVFRKKVCCSSYMDRNNVDNMKLNHIIRKFGEILFLVSCADLNVELSDFFFA